MILEVAILNVKLGHESAFEAAFAKAQLIIVATKGHISHQLQECIEKDNQYILLVNWEILEDHTVAFRESDEYREWKALLHSFYEPFPEIRHYEVVLKG